MLYLKSFTKYLIISSIFFSLNQIFSMQSPEYEGFEIIESSHAENFQIELENNTGHDLLVKLTYLKPKESQPFIKLFSSEKVLQADSKLVLDFFKDISGYNVELQEVKISYLNAYFNREITLFYDQLVQASKNKKIDIKVSLNKSDLGGINFEIKEKQQEPFINISNINVLNNYDRNMVIMKKVLNFDNDIVTQHIEFVLINSGEEKKINISPEVKNNSSLTTEIYVANGAGLGSFLEDINYIYDSKSRKSLDFLKDLAWVKFLDDDLTLKLNEDSKRGLRPILILNMGVIRNKNKYFDAPIITLGYKDEFTGKIIKSKYNVNQEVICDFNFK